MEGKSTLADKSEIVGINDYPLVTLQVETQGTVSAGQIKVKACPNNTAYVGQTIATLNFPLEGVTAGLSPSHPLPP